MQQEQSNNNNSPLNQIISQLKEGKSINIGGSSNISFNSTKNKLIFNGKVIESIDDLPPPYNFFAKKILNKYQNNPLAQLIKDTNQVYDSAKEKNEIETQVIEPKYTNNTDKRNNEYKYKQEFTLNSKLNSLQVAQIVLGILALLALFNFLEQF